MSNQALPLPAFEQASAQEPALGWPCAFLGCNALRIWEGGQASFNFPVCPRCDSPIAKSAADRMAMRRAIDENLF
jgi:hypothetical protein